MIPDNAWLHRSSPLFDAGRPVVVARAPGRLDVWGGILDYTGGTVCELPLARATHVALQPRHDQRVVVHSSAAAAHGLRETVEVPLVALFGGTYADVRQRLTADPKTAWAAYVLGAWTVLDLEQVAAVGNFGASLVIHSDVPLGAGVSSSAALEVASLMALTAALKVDLQPLRLAHLAQRVENQVVGAPCGLMDQLTAMLGQRDRLLVIRCQPDEILANQPLPPGVAVAAIHTGVRHAVGGAAYTGARTAAFMAYALLCRHHGRDAWGGYLARVPADEGTRAWINALPATMPGADFLRLGLTEHYVDPVTSVDPRQHYPVRAAASHHIFDNARGEDFRAALTAYAESPDPAALDRAGEAMLDSHRGYNQLGLGATEADLLVNLAMDRGPAHGIHGARITAGGSGGSVVLLGTRQLPAQVDSLAADYARHTGLTPTVLTGSSDGAAGSGAREVTR